MLVSNFGVLTVAKNFKWLHPLFVAPKGSEFVARATVTAVMEISHETTSGVVTEQLGPTP